MRELQECNWMEAPHLGFINWVSSDSFYQISWGPAELRYDAHFHRAGTIETVCNRLTGLPGKGDLSDIKSNCEND